MKNGMHIFIALVVVLTVLILCTLVKRACKKYIHRKSAAAKHMQYTVIPSDGSGKGMCVL